jgi:hypothetical protein
MENDQKVRIGRGIIESDRNGLISKEIKKFFQNWFLVILCFFIWD